jgi:DNA-binding transcriptional ArsR family regulator
MSADGLDPVIHGPARLRIMVTLATLPEGDDLSFSRLQDLLSLTPGNLMTHLRKTGGRRLRDHSENRRGGSAPTSVSLTRDGRAALARHTAILRELPDTAAPPLPARRD